MSTHEHARTSTLTRAHQSRTQARTHAHALVRLSRAPATCACHMWQVPVVDKWAGSSTRQHEGGLVACLKSGRIRVVGPVLGAGAGMVYAAAPRAGPAPAADGASVTVPCDAVILATGFEPRCMAAPARLARRW